MAHPSTHEPRWRYFMRDLVRYRSCRICPSYTEKFVGGIWRKA